MAHTFAEQTVTLNNTETFNAWLTETLGYILTDDGTAYSPKDPTFGIKFTMTDNSTGDGTLKITYDGGNSYTTIYQYGKDWSVTRFHVSKNEDVIYWRTKGKFYSKTDGYYRSHTFIIAHTNNGKTVFFSSKVSHEDNTNNYENNVWNSFSYISLFLRGNTRSGLYNSISKCPAFVMDDVCKELYLVNSVQTFHDLTKTYILHNGQFYRVVSCCSDYGTINTNVDNTFTDYPCFAFPVSD